MANCTSLGQLCVQYCSKCFVSDGLVFLGGVEKEIISHCCLAQDTYMAPIILIGVLMKHLDVCWFLSQETISHNFGLLTD